MTAMLVVASAAAACAEWTVVLLDHSESSVQSKLLGWLALHVDTVSSGHCWQFLSCFLLHPQPLHLVVNMFVLYFAGREVEPIIGMKHFAGLYAAGNVVGVLLQWGAMALGLAPEEAIFVGVSGGTAAVLAAYATILPELEVVLLLFFVIPLRVRAKFLGRAALALGAILWLAQAGSQIGPVAILGGCLTGWAYVKRLGYGNPMAVERYLFDRRQHAARIERMPAEQFIREELDPILEKIAKTGRNSLTRAERRMLEKGRAKLAARDVKTPICS